MGFDIELCLIFQQIFQVFMLSHFLDHDYNVECPYTVCTLLFLYLDPPAISVTGTTTPAVEYTERNLTCQAVGGNPPDPVCYKYDWIYKPSYDGPSAHNHVQSGRF